MAQEKGIDSLMTEGRTFPPPEQIKANAHISSMEQYQQMWDKSINDPDAFWLEQAKRLHWFKEPTKSLEYSWDTQARKIEHARGRHRAAKPAFGICPADGERRASLQSIRHGGDEAVLVRDRDHFRHAT